MDSISAIIANSTRYRVSMNRDDSTEVNLWIFDKLADFGGFPCEQWLNYYTYRACIFDTGVAANTRRGFLEGIRRPIYGTR